MTKTEAMRRARLDAYLMTLGFTESEVASLRRINSTLQRWYELECGDGNGMIERDEATGQPMWVTQALTYHRRTPIADREAGALRRLRNIVQARNARSQMLDACPTALDTYIQTDPRGAALYILRPGDISAGDNVESCYTRGVCVF